MGLARRALIAAASELADSAKGVDDAYRRNLENGFDDKQFEIWHKVFVKDLRANLNRLDALVEGDAESARDDQQA